jgi:DNA-binding response OmpR family regulator
MMGAVVAEHRVPPGRRGGRRAHGDALEETGRAVVPGASRSARILVVEDEPSMRFLCRINLEFAGFDIAEAATGAEALELAQASKLDLVLLDVMLPDIGGHEIARRLTARGESPFAFLSARAGADDIRTGYELGAVDYITKPFDPIELADRVSEILGRIERGETEQYRLDRLVELEE